MKCSVKNILHGLSLALMLSGAAWSDPNGMALENIDWDSLAVSQSTVDRAVIDKYKPVLTGSQPFIWTFGYYDIKSVPNKSPVSLEQFNKIFVKEVFSDEDSEKSRAFAEAIAAVDLDGDGTRELILLLSSCRGQYLILHREGDKFYGIDKVFRGFGDLHTNGVYFGSDGAAHTYYLKLSCKNGDFKESVVGEFMQDGEDKHYKKHYIYNGQSLDEAAWNKKLFGNSVEAVYYRFDNSSRQ